jgi:hypothetical protein
MSEEQQDAVQQLRAETRRFAELTARCLELLLNVEAQAGATRAVLNALIDTHPDPAAALEALLSEMDSYADINAKDGGAALHEIVPALVAYRNRLSLRCVR